MVSDMVEGNAVHRGEHGGVLTQHDATERQIIDVPDAERYYRIGSNRILRTLIPAPR